MTMIKTSLEQYVEQNGIIGALHLLNNRVINEKNGPKREFFKTCRNILTIDRGGRIFEAAKRHHANK